MQFYTFLPICHACCMASEERISPVSMAPRQLLAGKLDFLHAVPRFFSTACKLIAQDAEIAVRARAAAQKELEEATLRLHCLNEKIVLCQKAIEGKCEDDCNPLNW